MIIVIIVLAVVVLLVLVFFLVHVLRNRDIRTCNPNIVKPDKDKNETVTRASTSIMETYLPRR